MLIVNPQQFPCRLIAFTTPQIYAVRLSHLIHLNGWTPLWCPTVTVDPTPATISALQNFFLPPDFPLRHFSALAFTSRAGIAAFSEALAGIDAPPLSPIGEILTISALGKDSELLDSHFIGRLCENPRRIRVLVPQLATPSGMVEALGLGLGRKVLCPVPTVIGLTEPPVVPKLVADLERRGWEAVRVSAYETRWRRGGAGGEDGRGMRRGRGRFHEYCGGGRAAEELGGSGNGLGKGERDVPADGGGSAWPGDGGGGGEIGGGN